MNSPNGRRSTRISISNRVSRLFSRRTPDSPRFEESQRSSAACTVPIFMTSSSDRMVHEAYDTDQYVEPSAEHTLDERHRPITIQGSSVYSATPGQQYPDHLPEDAMDDSPRSPASLHDLEQGTSSISYATSETPIVRDKHRRRRRISESTRQKIASKKRLGMAFGVTTLATVITCKQLYRTHTRSSVLRRNRCCFSCFSHSKRSYLSYPFSALHTHPSWCLPSQLDTNGHAAETSQSQARSTSRMARLPK